LKITKLNFASIIKALGYKVEAEFKFAPNRKFRADWKVSKNGKSCLVEYEGVMSAKSRHTNTIGFSTDCEKYNLAQLLGYVVLRYTLFNFNCVIADLEKFFK
jgi:hypothetical protein